MKLTIYVHDFHLEIGHTRATIDLLNHLTLEQKSAISEISVISYSATDPSILLQFPMGTKIRFIKVPFPHIYPFLFKSIFYQLWTGARYLFLKSKNEVSLSIGIAFLFPDIVNIQFIHHHWNELNSLFHKYSWHKKVYKKILFFYFNFLERIIYGKANTRFVVLSHFTRDYLIEKFHIAKEQATLAYSNVNHENFFLLENEKNIILNELGSEAQGLSSIDFNKPIFLFVGAFERKGLLQAMLMLEEIQGAQFIIIGKSESGENKIPQSDRITIFHIPFTKKLNSYYNLADYFIFPTLYEPFGLVVLEAAMTGLRLIIPKKNLGASELLLKDEFTSFIDDQKFSLPNMKILSKEERRSIIERRKKDLSQYSWDQSASLFFTNVLSKYLPAERS